MKKIISTIVLFFMCNIIIFAQKIEKEGPKGFDQERAHV